MRDSRLARSSLKAAHHPTAAPAIEGYTIERELGRGGEAVVYLAHDQKHGRSVAVKILRVELAAKAQVDRFLREISTISALAHPNIVPLLDSGRTGDCLYYVAPYIAGESLRQRLQREDRLPATEAARIVSEIAEALDHAHRHGVVHRDIKPENILLADGHPMLADFGIARALTLSGNVRLTGEGVLVGTPQYMSPEQVGGDAELGPQSDIYSLGCVLYELLTGMPPFSAESPAQLIAQHVSTPPPHVSSKRPDIGLTADGVLQRALAKLPDDRYPSAGEFANAFTTSLRDKRLLSRLWIPSVGGSSRLVAACIAISAIGGTTWWIRSDAVLGGADNRVRIIVLPSDNRTASREFDVLGVMVADWLTMGLQRNRFVEVIPTTTAIQTHTMLSRHPANRGVPQDPVAAVASETGAHIVVTSAVYQRSDRLLFQVQVTDVARRYLVETIEDVEAPISDPLLGVEEVRARLMTWLAVEYDERLRSELAEHSTPPLYPAYVAFAEGLDAYMAADFEEALPHFLRAYAIDTVFVPALLYASLCSSNLENFQHSDSLLTIVELSRDRLSIYHRAWLDYRVAFLRGRHEDALKAIRVAASLAPDSKASYNHAVTAFQTGYPREALEVLKRIPPERGPMRGFLPYWDMRAAVHHALGEYAAERAIASRQLRLYPRRLFAFAAVIRSHATSGELDQIEAALKEAARVPVDPMGEQYDLGYLMLEAAEELEAHGHRLPAHRFLKRAQRWYTSSPQNENSRRRKAYLAYRVGDDALADSLVAVMLEQEPQDLAALELRGLLHARAGRVVAANATSSTIENLKRPYEFGAAELAQARIAAALGDDERSLETLRAAFSSGLTFDLWLHRDQDLKRLYQRLDDEDVNSRAAWL